MASIVITSAVSGNWSVPKIIKNLHSLEHRYLDHGGSADEIINEAEDWGRSIAFLACCFASLALVAILWDILVRLIGSCCCTCCCRNGVPEYGRLQEGAAPPSGGWCSSEGWIDSPPKPGHRCRWCSSAILFLLAVGVFVGAVIASGHLKTNVTELSNEARAMQEWKDGLSDYATTLSTTLSVAKSNVASVKQQSTGEPLIISECDRATKVLTDANTQVSKYFKMIPNQDITKYVDKVDKHITPAIVPGHIGLLFFFALFFLSIVLISRSGAIASKPCSYSCCHILGLLSFFVTWIFVAVYIGMAVGMSDGCMDPHTLTHNAAVQFLSKDSVDLVDYYSTCSGVNPLQSQIDFATNYVDDAHNSVVRLRTYATVKKPSLLPTIAKLDANVQSANATLHQLLNVLDCHTEGGITDYYQQALNSFCGEKGVVVNLSQVFICIAVAELLYIIARWCLPVCNCCRRSLHRHGYIQSPNNGGDDRAAYLLDQPVAGASPSAPSQQRSVNPFGVVVTATPFTGRDQPVAVAIATPIDDGYQSSSSAYGQVQLGKQQHRASTSSSSAYGSNNNGW